MSIQDASEIGQRPLDDALPDDKSVTLAGAFIDRHGLDGDRRAILHLWNGEFFKFDGHVYQRVADGKFHSDVYHFLKSISVIKKVGGETRGKIKTISFQPEPKHTKAVVETLAMELHRGVDRMPCWLDPAGRPNPRSIVVFRNGLLDIDRWIVDRNVLPLPPTPAFFSTVLIPHDYRRGGSCPAWEAFLRSSLSDDAERIALLQEWAGLLLVRDTSYQKMMWLVGVSGSGKGTVIRQLQRIVGAENICNPSLTDLSTNFGLESLIGKTSAMLPDAHLGGREDPSKVLDVVLAITGEDSINITRKYLPPLSNVRLNVRFTIGVNKFPTLPDSSNAIIRRSLVIPFEESFDGRADRGLEGKLAAETPAIVSWALDGLARLREAGRFTEVTASRRLISQFKRLNSPMYAYLSDRCVVGPQESVAIDEMFKDHNEWRAKNGHSPISKIKMGIDLGSTGVLKDKSRPGGREDRKRSYVGLRLKRLDESDNDIDAGSSEMSKGAPEDDPEMF